MDAIISTSFPRQAFGSRRNRQRKNKLPSAPHNRICRSAAKIRMHTNGIELLGILPLRPYYLRAFHSSGLRGANSAWLVMAVSAAGGLFLRRAADDGYALAAHPSD